MWSGCGLGMLNRLVCLGCVECHACDCVWSECDGCGLNGAGGKGSATEIHPRSTIRVSNPQSLSSSSLTFFYDYDMDMTHQ